MQMENRTRISQITKPNSINQNKYKAYQIDAQKANRSFKTSQNDGWMSKIRSNSLKASQNHSFLLPLYKFSIISIPLTHIYTHIYILAFHQS